MGYLTAFGSHELISEALATLATATIDPRNQQLRKFLQQVQGMALKLIPFNHIGTFLSRVSMSSLSVSPERECIGIELSISTASGMCLYLPRYNTH